MVILKDCLVFVEGPLKKHILELIPLYEESGMPKTRKF